MVTNIDEKEIRVCSVDLGIISISTNGSCGTGEMGVIGL